MFGSSQEYFKQKSPELLFSAYKDLLLFFIFFISRLSKLIADIWRRILKRFVSSDNLQMMMINWGNNLQIKPHFKCLVWFIIFDQTVPGLNHFTSFKNTTVPKFLRLDMFRQHSTTLNISSIKWKEKKQGEKKKRKSVCNNVLQKTSFIVSGLKLRTCFIQTNLNDTQPIVQNKPNSSHMSVFNVSVLLLLFVVDTLKSDTQEWTLRQRCLDDPWKLFFPAACVSEHKQQIHQEGMRNQQPNFSFWIEFNFYDCTLMQHLKFKVIVMSPRW